MTSVTLTIGTNMPLVGYKYPHQATTTGVLEQPSTRSQETNNTGISGSSSPFSYKLKKTPPASVKVKALGPNRDRNSNVLIENDNPLKEIKDDGTSSVADVDPISTVAGEDPEVSYDEAATDDQLVTPWSLSVARGKIREVLRNWPQRNIQVIVVTDGERILGLGDLGCQGMGIPIGKLSLYTAVTITYCLQCLPVTIDVGTNNEELLNDKFYIGLRQRRATGQFEDFENHIAFDLLAKYSTTLLVFNDDIQGRAIFASGSPFDPVEYNGRVFVPGQANNAYIFPGLGLGLILSGAIRVHDDMLLAASEALAAQVTQENFDKGLIYPPFRDIRKISAHIAANVAAKAYQLGKIHSSSINMIRHATPMLSNRKYHHPIV
ncbi:NADP-dependent malic enzyme [Hibiscus syriacus]|uniref:NADP-dependent malic enzyme n=1 Tax=Hibiscus syriacus TaxID=106335 RepID=A0A6A2X328_HIBSY|nr:NADP-dependent malic enzyme [Hibiscus syriacus]